MRALGTTLPKASVQSHLPRAILIIEVKRQKSPAFEPHRFYAGFLFQLHKCPKRQAAQKSCDVSTYILLSMNQKRLTSLAES